MVADKYDFAGLRQRGLDVVCGKFEMLPTVEFQRLDQRLLQEILKSDKIQAAEEFVLKRLLEWFENEEEERRQYMPKLLKLIRLELFPSQVCFIGCRIIMIEKSFIDNYISTSSTGLQ